MGDLIQALQIFQSIRSIEYPTQCEHDVLLIAGIGKDEVSAEQATRLNYLGFLWSVDYGCWASYQYGSA